MNAWIEKQKYLIDFTLASLARRTAKSLGLLAVYALIVFLLAFVLFNGLAGLNLELFVADTPPPGSTEGGLRNAIVEGDVSFVISPFDEFAIEEASLSLRDYLSRLEADPARLDEIESRLAVLDKLAKGNSLVRAAGITRDKLGSSVTDQALNGIFKYIGAEEGKLAAQDVDG